MDGQLAAFWRDEEGATATGYGLVAGLIAMASLLVLALTSPHLDTLYDSVGGTLQALARLCLERWPPLGWG